jgi:hypothetical protein
MAAVVKRVRQAAVVAAVALVVAGCSGVKVVYNSLDTLVPWYFEDYVSLDTGQKELLRGSVRTLLAWHRESQIGRYAAVLRDLGADAATPLGRVRLDGVRLQIEEFWDEIVRQLLPEAATLLSGLTDRQVDEMFRSIAEKDAEEREELLDRTPAEALQRREKSLRRSVERWVGSLDRRQLGLVEQCARELRPQGLAWLDTRKAWQQQFRAALALRHDRERFLAALTPLFVEPDRYWSPDYRRQFDLNRDRVMDLLAEVDASLDTAQRQRLQRHLAGWAQDLESIAGGS